MHRHRANPKRREIWGWTYCVAPDTCRGDATAHGAVVYIDRCSCGATRLTEANAGSKASSGWRSDPWDDHAVWPLSDS